jgi:small subunit ribosomal protein S13
MARIAGVVIPAEKQVHIALTYIYGVGRKHSAAILAAASVEPTTRVKDLTEAEEQRTRKGRAVAVGGAQPKAASKT